MGKRLDINPGDRYNRLAIIREVEKIHNTRTFLCKCDCGNERSITLIQLRLGQTKSCGCLKNEIFIKRNTIHNLSRTDLYRVWTAMKQRCLNKSCDAYKYYGGRGITACDDWVNGFINFYNWAELNGYKKGLTIERVDNNGNYEPENCIWVTQKHQNTNKRGNRIIEYQGHALCVSEWSIKLGINRNSLIKRLNNWSVEKALTMPIKSR